MRNMSKVAAALPILGGVFVTCVVAQPSSPMPPGAVANNVRAVGYSEVDGRPPFKLSVQECNGRWYLYMGHLWHRVQPDNIVAQTESSIVYGVGLTLSERISFKDGIVQQSNFYDYRVPRMRDIPEMHVKLLPTPNPPTGVGQMATPLIAPAVASAVHAVIKVRLRHTPFIPERVVAALSA